MVTVGYVRYLAKSLKKAPKIWIWVAEREISLI